MKRVVSTASIVLGTKQTPDRHERQGTSLHRLRLSSLAFENMSWLALPELRPLGLTMSFFLGDSCDSTLVCF